MRSALAVLPLFALMRFGLADLDWDDVPGNCRSQCEPVDTIFTDCAREVGTDVSVDFFRNGTLDLDNDGRPDRDEIPGPDDDDRDDNDRDDNRDDNRDNDRDDDPAVEQRYVDCVCNKQNARTDFPNCSDCLIRNNYRDTEVGDFVRACRFSGATGVTSNNTASPTATLTTTNAAGSTILSTLAPTSTNITGTGVNNNQPAQVTGAASKLGAAQNVLIAAALAGLPAAAFL
ncbi:hypothetical protein IWX49DRAFT_596670 [Phyllosticta citricarpa]